MLEVVAGSQNVSPSVQAYTGSWDLLRDELKRLDLLIQLQLCKQKSRQPPGPLDQFKGLVVTETEIAGLLMGLASNYRNQTDADGVNRDTTELMNALVQINSEITERRAISIDDGVYLSLPRISELFGLNPFEERSLVVCLAPEIDRSYEKLYAYLQDDVTRRKPSVDLLMNLLLSTMSERLLARAAFEPDGTLLKFRLLQLFDDSAAPTPLISRFLKLDDRIVDFLLGRGRIDARLGTIASLSNEDDFESIQVGGERENQIRDFVRAYFGEPGPRKENLVFYFYGPYGSGKRALAELIATDLGLPLIVGDVSKINEAQLPFEEAVWLLGREALLQPAILCLDNFDHLVAGDPNRRPQLEALLEMVRSCSVFAILLGAGPWNPRGLLKNSQFLDVGFTVPDDGERRNFWVTAASRGFQLAEDVDPGAIASKFRLTQGQIQDALASARARVSLRSPGVEAITSEDLEAACRAQSSEKLSALARKIEPGHVWDDIVLPDEVLKQLREICQRVVYRHRVLSDWGFGAKLSLGKGVNALFAGPSGTGKTMATEIIARELGLDLYKIDLSGVVSKYIGETERNLDRVFSAAEDANAILFFDEADALFGKRSEVRDSHDRYANIEISYLLQKMEEYEGLAILATNLRANLDEAFIRRLAFTIHFPFPDEASRLRIWRGIWPTSMSLDYGVDLELLAEQFKLSGGNIKNIALAAAFLAAECNSAVTMAHLLHATRREFQKLGKPLVGDQLGPYAIGEASL
jgi:SpoVK/Ycf46/Vps4 family AAA+-type ATPase